MQTASRRLRLGRRGGMRPAGAGGIAASTVLVKLMRVV